ncbi:hypothetical protein O6H91_07G019200 [Diphasiastrum complanatum]|nr:hypothetical protein O6H91_07G019200 [Diphasiastrum complanatum]
MAEMTQRGKGIKKPSVGDAKLMLSADIEDLQCRNQFDFTYKEAEDIRGKLLDWYDKNHRVLPWRENLHSKLDLGDKYEQIASLPNISLMHKKDPVRRKSKKPKVEANARKMGSKTSLQGQKLGSGCDKFETEEKLAYSVWVSEVMLQQTRVETVIPYFQRWMVKWPSLLDLAQANQEEVNSMWAGLGYYRRARFLLEGAKYVSGQLGAFPRCASKLQEIPGIGKYTAGAIASIAFKQPVPVVDGNVIRVLCRLRAISSNVKAPTTINLLWELAEQLVDQKRPGDLNQALMELGATVCTKHNPSCSSCPISNHCKALALVAQHESLTNGPTDTVALVVTDFPTKVIKASPRKEYVAVCILEVAMDNTKGPLFLLVQRPPTGLLAGLWEFPSAMLATADASLEMRTAAIDSYLQNSLGIHVGAGHYVITSRDEIGQYTHIFSHIRLHMFIEWLQIRSDRAILSPKMEGKGQTVRKWVDANQLANLGLTSGVRKVHTMLLKFQQARIHHVSDE